MRQSLDALIAEQHRTVADYEAAHNAANHHSTASHAAFLVMKKAMKPLEKATRAEVRRAIGNPNTHVEVCAYPSMDHRSSPLIASPLLTIRVVACMMDEVPRRDMKAEFTVVPRCAIDIARVAERIRATVAAWADADQKPERAE